VRDYEQRLDVSEAMIHVAMGSLCSAESPIETILKRTLRRHRIDRIARKEVEELSEGLSLDVLPQSERSILIDAILPAKPVDLAEQYRLAAFAVLLWLSGYKGREVDEFDVYEAAREPAQNIPAALYHALDGWLDATQLSGLVRSLVIHNAERLIIENAENIALAVDALLAILSKRWSTLFEKQGSGRRLQRANTLMWNRDWG
jgi:hypothetical protein